MIDFQALAENKGIIFKGPDKRGWLHFRCPFCQDDLFHLGFHNSTWTCFRCGKKKQSQILRYVFHTELSQALSFKKKGVNTPSVILRKKEFQAPIKLTKTIPSKAWNYLKEERKFEDIYSLQTTWDFYFPAIMDIAGKWKYRIIVPIYLDGKMVSWFGRDYTNKQENRYEFPPDEMNVVNPKDVIYGLDLANPDLPLVLVEGPLDVWKLGPQSGGAFGTSLTDGQIQLLKKKGFNHLILVGDNDEPGIQAVEHHFSMLTILGFDVQMTNISSRYKDPGQMEDETARKFMQNILKGYV